MAYLSLDNVTVQYPIYNSRGMSLRNQLLRLGTGGRIEAEAGHINLVTALRDVSLSLKDGDTVGLVGHNGAGKTTLLRTMAGIYTPTMGQVASEGKLATIFEIGAGMDPELSGYENIVRMSMMMGMSLAEAQASFPEIEEFTELGDFLQLPVRTYSSGMTMRLMFAVATSTQPEILLIDEMFGTGDSSFKQKAHARITKIINSSKIFVFASHSHDILKQFCQRFFMLDHGRATEIDAKELE